LCWLSRAAHSTSSYHCACAGCLQPAKDVSKSDHDDDGDDDNDATKRAARIHLSASYTPCSPINSCCLDVLHCMLKCGERDDIEAFCHIQRIIIRNSVGPIAAEREGEGEGNGSSRRLCCFSIKAARTKRSRRSTRSVYAPTDRSAAVALGNRRRGLCCTCLAPTGWLAVAGERTLARMSLVSNDSSGRRRTV
jgi:hypothetical protein